MTAVTSVIFRLWAVFCLFYFLIMNDNKEVAETLKAANLYLNSLKNLNTKIESAEKQIAITSRETESAIEVIFDNLLIDLTKTLDKRKRDLQKLVQETKQQSLIPLEECQNDITKKIETTQTLLNECQRLVQNNSFDRVNFDEKSSFLGTLPEIPELKEVTCISFQYDLKTHENLLDVCSNFGTISKIAPVQINQITEKPGALLIEFQYIESDDRFTDIQEFRLQRAFGDVISEKHLTSNFKDCYLGIENQVLVKDLKFNQLYSFRVCCKFEGSTDWSPWSVNQVAKTTIKNHCWRENSDFRLADENKIATPVKEKPTLLVSDGALMAVGYSVEFTFLEFDQKLSTVGLLLLINKSDVVVDLNCLKHESHFMFRSNGEIVVNGVVKSTKLPPATKGMKVCFTCDLINDDKVMVNIDACDKRVTYDWHIPKNSKIHFVAEVQSSNTKIMVE